MDGKKLLIFVGLLYGLFPGIVPLRVISYKPVELEDDAEEICILKFHNLPDNILFPKLIQRMHYKVAKYSEFRKILRRRFFKCNNYHVLYREILVNLLATILLKQEEIMQTRISCALNAEVKLNLTLATRAAFFVHYLKAYIERSKLIVGKEFAELRKSLYPPRSNRNAALRAFDTAFTKIASHSILSNLYRKLNSEMWGTLMKKNMGSMRQFMELLRDNNVTKAKDKHELCEEAQALGDKAVMKKKQRYSKNLSNFAYINVMIIVIVFYFKAVDYDFLRLRGDSEVKYREGGHPLTYSIFRANFGRDRSERSESHLSVMSQASNF